MLNHLSALSIERRFSDPPPLFSMVKPWDRRCGLEEEPENESTAASTLN